MIDNVKRSTKRQSLAPFVPTEDERMTCDLQEGAHPLVWLQLWPDFAL